MRNRFFEDLSSLSAFYSQIMPLLVQNMKKAPASRKYKILSTAQSSKKEAQSIALLIHEFLFHKSELEPKRFQIIANLHPESALNFQFENLHGLSEHLQKRYFKSEKGTWKLLPQVLKLIHYQNLQEFHLHPKAPKIDCIFCCHLFENPNNLGTSTLLQGWLQLLKIGGIVIAGSQKLPPECLDIISELKAYGKGIYIKTKD